MLYDSARVCCARGFILERQARKPLRRDDNHTYEEGKSKKRRMPAEFQKLGFDPGELMTPLAWATASSRTKIDLLLQAAGVC